MRRLLLLILSLVPGSVMILRGRTMAGVGLMLMGAIGWDLAILAFSGLWLKDGAEIYGGLGMVAAVVATVRSLTWTFLETSGRRSRRIEELVQRTLRSAYESYLKGKIVDAEQTIDTGLKTAAEDEDLLFVGWHLAHGRGSKRLVRRLKRRLDRADVDGKWSWEREWEEQVDHE